MISFGWRRESPWWSLRERFRGIVRYGAYEIHLLAYRTIGVHGKRYVAEVYDPELDLVLIARREGWIDTARRRAEDDAIALMPKEASIALERFIAKRDERPREVAELRRIARWRREARPWLERKDS